MTDKPFTLDIDLVGLTVRDLNLTRDFFVNCLGWKQVGETQLSKVTLRHSHNLFRRAPSCPACSHLFLRLTTVCARPVFKPGAWMRKLVVVGTASPIKNRVQLTSRFI